MDGRGNGKGGGLCRGDRVAAGTSGRPGVNTWRRCTHGCGESAAMTAACGWCSGTGGVPLRRQPSGRGGASRPRPGCRRRWTGQTFRRCWSVTRRSTCWRCTWCCRGAGRKRSSGRGRRTWLLARLPHGLLRPARRRAGGSAGGQREDRDRARRRRLGYDQPELPALCRADEVPRRCLRAAAAARQPRAQTSRGIPAPRFHRQTLLSRPSRPYSGVHSTGRRITASSRSSRSFR